MLFFCPPRLVELEGGHTSNLLASNAQLELGGLADTVGAKIYKHHGDRYLQIHSSKRYRQLCGPMGLCITESAGHEASVLRPHSGSGAEFLYEPLEPRKGAKSSRQALVTPNSPEQSLIGLMGLPWLPFSRL